MKMKLLLIIFNPSNTRFTPTIRPPIFQLTFSIYFLVIIPFSYKYFPENILPPMQSLRYTIFFIANPISYALTSRNFPFKELIEISEYKTEKNFKKVKPQEHNETKSSVNVCGASSCPFSRESCRRHGGKMREEENSNLVIV